MHRLCIDRRRHSSGGEPKERFMIMDLGSAFAVSVARQPGQIAIVEGDRRVSYSDWYCEIKAVGGALRDMGLKPGDHFVAVMRNRYEMTASTAHISQNQYRQGDSCLGVMPFFHTMGVRILLGMALLNGRLVCLPAYQPEEVLRLIAAEKLTTLYLVPTMFHDVLRHPKFADYDLSSLSRVGYAGMTMVPALVERCLEQLKPELFVNYYGPSEIYTFTYCDHLDRNPGFARRAGMNQIIRVVSPSRKDDIEINMPLGVSGEIVASMNSPEAFKGYWKRPDADAKSIQGRWYRTGDLGKIHEDGELFVVGRVDDMIISGGENIFPEEVEDTLIRSKLVAGVAVVGMPDDRLGTKVVAFIEPAVFPLGPRQPYRSCLPNAIGPLQTAHA